MTTPEAAPPPAAPAGLEAASQAAAETATQYARGQVTPPKDGSQELERVAPDPADAAPEPLPEDPPVEAGPTLRERAMAGADKARRQRLQRQREAAEAQAAREERDRLAQSAEYERQQRMHAERRAQDAEQRAAVADALKDPDPERRMQALLQIGVDPRAFAQDAVDASTPEGRMRLFEARQAARDKAIDERERRAAAREASIQQQQAEAEFVDGISVDEHPTLSRLARNRRATVVAEGNSVMNDVYRRTGRYPSFEQVRAYLEGEYSKLRDEKPTRESGTQQGTKANPPATEKQPAASARTITARASERAVLPKSVAEMTKEEQIAYFASQLQDTARG